MQFIFVVQNGHITVIEFNFLDGKFIVDSVGFLSSRDEYFFLEPSEEGDAVTCLCGDVGRTKCHQGWFKGKVDIAYDLPLLFGRTVDEYNFSEGAEDCQEFIVGTDLHGAGEDVAEEHSGLG